MVNWTIQEAIKSEKVILYKTILVTNLSLDNKSQTEFSQWDNTRLLHDLQIRQTKTQKLTNPAFH